MNPGGRSRIELAKEKAILALRLEGKPYAAIARLVGVSPSTAFEVVRDAATRSMTPDRRRRDTRLPARIRLWLALGWTLARVAQKLQVSTATVFAHSAAACAKPR